MLRLATEPDEREPLPRSGWWGLLSALLGPRGTLAALTAIAVLGLSLVVVLGVPGRLSAWVHERPEYAWTIDEVVLDPPPPAWLPGGRSALIASASETLSGSAVGSAIGVSLEALDRAFRKARWVDGVDSIRRSYPDRITVSLRYQGRPVGLAHLPGPDGMTDHYIDESGVILAESSPEALDDFGPVIRLEEIEPPPSTFPGSSWTLPDSPSELNPVALAAARLASFLIGQAEDQGMPTTRDGRPVQFLRIQSLRRDDAIAEYRWMTGQPDADPTPEQIRQTQRSRLYVRVGLPNGRDFWVLWQNAPGSPREQGEPDALEKMAMFREWLSRRDPRSPFSDDGALCFDQQQGPQWKHRSR